jgi:hypothetical protein
MIAVHHLPPPPPDGSDSGRRQPDANTLLFLETLPRVAQGRYRELARLIKSPAIRSRRRPAVAEGTVLGTSRQRYVSCLHVSSPHVRIRPFCDGPSSGFFRPFKMDLTARSTDLDPLTEIQCRFETGLSQAR